jgi:hypothetical protein
MIFVIGLPVASVDDVRYRWLSSGVLGAEQSTGISQVGTFLLFRIDTNPPAGAEELIVYDTNDLTSFSLAHYSEINSGGGGGGGGADPWDVYLPGTYAAHKAGAILAKLDVGPPEDPVIVIPGAPADLSLCRVYGYLETLDNKPAANVTIAFKLALKTGAKSDRIISGRTITVTTDSDGVIQDSDGNPYIDLQRNDHITPTGSKYLVNSGELGLKGKEISLESDLFDLADAIP